MLTILCTFLNAERSISKPEPKNLKCELDKAFEIPNTLSFNKSVEHGQARRRPIGVTQNRTFLANAAAGSCHGRRHTSHFHPPFENFNIKR